MTWQCLVLGLELLSPLHIGFLPNQPGSVLARTRCYVPGKSLWGSVVASITPRLHQNVTASDYQDIGRQLCRDVCFSYFYLSDHAQVFFPDYGENGLSWGNMSDREFRSRFVGAYVSTRLGESGGAQDGTLHEIEFIRRQAGSPAEPVEKVVLAGMVWIQKGAKVGQQVISVHDGSAYAGDVDIFAGIHLGGERNYGFGRVRRVVLPEGVQKEVCDHWPDSPEVEVPVDISRPLPGHIPYRKDIPFKGQVEIVAGREYPSGGEAEPFRRAGAHISASRDDEGYCFGPGTRLGSTGGGARLNPWGRLVWTQ